MSTITRLLHRLFNLPPSRARQAVDLDGMALSAWADLPAYHPLSDRTPR